MNWTSSTTDEIRIRPEGEISPLKHVLISCFESLPAQSSWKASHRANASCKEKDFSFLKNIVTLNSLIEVRREADRRFLNIKNRKTHHRSGAAAIKTLRTLYLTVDFTSPKTKVLPSIFGTMENPSGLPNNMAAAK
jgi:hypothetical protein